jgi:LPS sulfotransferase NodH
MRRPLRLVFLAHPRSGSTSVFKILNLHPALDLLEEPFNEDFASWAPENPDYLPQVHDRATLDAVLATIFARCNGFKIQDYQLPDELLTHLVHAYPSHVLFLRRRNLLQTVVSNLIAVQTAVWKKWELRQPLADAYRQLQPLDITQIKRWIAELDDHMRWCDALLDTLPDGAVHRLVYEDLFFASAAERERQIGALWPWLGLEPPADPRVSYYLDPLQVKLNSAETYRWLPNAAAIERACGSDATGWLFR